ncbi:MAG: hypothetical protein FJ138_09930, partial [Deltaproteobacteria bacterium]|nr:hypothetical protein [Deltaproteobacteria bacterium]
MTPRTPPATRPWRRVRRALVALALTATAACDSAPDVTPVADPDFGYVPVEPGLDMKVVSDAYVGDDGVIFTPKAFGEPCESNSQCASAQCITLGEGGVCTQACLGENCPSGWGCRGVANTGADLQFLCVPTDERLCKPCASDGDCPAGACLSVDGLSVCGAECAEDSDCVEGYACRQVPEAAAKQCVPATGSCTCNPTKDGDRRICERANGFGACVGRQVCGGAAGWSACDAQEPAAEVCNQLDDNCNGFTDDLPMLGEVCTRETEVDGAAVVCSGRVLCTSASPEPICTALTPGPELCNFLDDDCDGDTDEEFSERDTVCSVGRGLCQRYGVYECSEDGARVECNVFPGAAVAEVCDGLDNDCDGVLDNGFTGVGATCEVGQGLCRRVGVRRCAPDGAGVVCDVEPGTPAAEVCDGLDNDCDGVIDDGFAGLNEICTLGVGACQQSSFTRCAADGQRVECGLNPAALLARAQPERCDGVDNDCDGGADEDFGLLFSPCAVGQGACLRQGLFVCAASQEGEECSVQPGAPTDERCDGLDNDCDGDVDDRWPTLGGVCALGRGLCERSGVFVCPADGVSAAVCNADVVQGAASEACDFQDDDCDGRADEGFTDARGAYSLVTACGACGNDCAQQWGGDPARFNVRPVCAAAGGAFRCDYECLPGAVDADGQPRNGCELVADPNAIYVSTAANGGSSQATCGAVSQPCATIALGLSRAQAAGRRRVLVSEGVYREVVTLVSGVDLLGGFDRLSWVRLPDVYITQIDTRALASAEPHRYGVKAVGVTLPTTLDGFVINSGTPLTGGNSYGVYVEDSTAALAVSNNRVTSGDGGRGVDGASGGSGVPGQGGRVGVTGRAVTITNIFSCSGIQAGVTLPLPGGSSPTQSCGGVSTRGGAGGSSSCPLGGEPANPGFSGATARGGVAGLGGNHLYSDRAGVCTVLENPIDARDGAAGGAGQDGLGGTRAGVALGRLLSAHWAAFAGNAGEAGVPGGGGGGGGAAAGVQIGNWVTPANTHDVGSSGGSGGNGGCGGLAGAGGGAGGGSFGVYVTFVSAPPARVADMPVVTGNRVQRGFGGAGGAGGNGGGGGEGGLGGEGAPGGDTTLDHCSLQAGSGGAGGRGGHGGGGAGGNGGASFDVFVARAQSLIPASYAANNEFLLNAAELTAGGGGPGGNSSNTVTGVGVAGLSGASGQVGSLQ